MIKNQEQLTHHGFFKGRTIALDIVKHAVQAVNARVAMQQKVTLLGNILKIKNHRFDLNQFNHIYVLGAGKATFPMAVALEEILGDRITDGFVCVKYGQAGHLNRIRVMEAGHPVPDDNSLEAGRITVEIARKAGANDLVICLMSGGVSALCCQPVKGVTFDDKRQTSRLMVNSGADIGEIMTVRGRLSDIKHGRLAHVIHPARMISLTVSDAIGDPMNLNTDWTSMDSSTHKDAVAIMKKYDIWDKVPDAVQSYFTAMETKQEDHHKSQVYNIHNIMIVKTTDLTTAAEAYAQKLGLNTLVLTSMLCGESREAGRFFTSIAREIHLSNRPAATPCALIATGETAVRIENEDVGKGGRNQEFAAGACLDLRQTDPIAVCSLGTDGTDGPTHVAGALTDGSTVIRADEIGMDIHEKLKKHDILPLLSGTGDAIETQNTETNVCDIAVAVIL